MFAKAYVGRKRRAKPLIVFCRADSLTKGRVGGYKLQMQRIGLK